MFFNAVYVRLWGGMGQYFPLLSIMLRRWFPYLVTAGCCFSGTKVAKNLPGLLGMSCQAMSSCVLSGGGPAVDLPVLGSMFPGCVMFPCHGWGAAGKASPSTQRIREEEFPCTGWQSNYHEIKVINRRHPACSENPSAYSATQHRVQRGRNISFLWIFCPKMHHLHWLSTVLSFTACRTPWHSCRNSMEDNFSFVGEVTSSSSCETKHLKMKHFLTQLKVLWISRLFFPAGPATLGDEPREETTEALQSCDVISIGLVFGGVFILFFEEN